MSPTPTTFTVSCPAPEWELTVTPRDWIQQQDGHYDCYRALQGDWSLLATNNQIAAPHREEDRIRIPLEIIDRSADTVREMLVNTYGIRSVGDLLPENWLADLDERLGLQASDRLLMYEDLVFRAGIFDTLKTVPQLTVTEIRCRNTPARSIETGSRCACSSKPDQGVQIRELCLGGEGLQFRITEQPGARLRELLRLAVGESMTIPCPALTLTCTSHEVARYDGVYTSPDGTQLAFQLAWE